MKKLNNISIVGFTLSVILSNTLAGNINTKVIQSTPKYFLQGIVKDGTLYRSKVNVYNEEGEKIGSTIIKKPNGIFLFKDLEQKPAFVEVKDGMDIGLDKEIGGKDDQFFDENYFAKINGNTVRVTPVTTLEFFTGKKVELDKKNKLLLENIIDLLESFGLSSKEAYKAVSDSLDADEKISTISLDYDKLVDSLKGDNVNSDKLSDIVEKLKELIKESDLSSNEEIYAINTITDSVKNIIEYENLEENTQINVDNLIDPVFKEKVKSVIDEEENTDLKSLSILISNRVMEDEQNVHKLFERDSDLLANAEEKQIKQVRKASSVKVIDGPTTENFKVYISCDNKGFLVQNVFSDRYGICKINENGMLKEVKLQRKYVRVQEIDNPSIDDKFNVIKDYLKDLFSFEINTKPVIKIDNKESKNFILTVVLRKLDQCNGEEKGFLTASILVNIRQDGNRYIFSIPSGSKIFLTGNTDKFNSFVITKKTNIKERLVCIDGTSKFVVGDYVEAVLNQYKHYLTKDVKETIYENVTNPGVFEIYIMLNETDKNGGIGKNNRDFIKNPYLFDATKYQLDLNPYNQNFTDKEHAFKISIKLI